MGCSFIIQLTSTAFSCTFFTQDACLFEEKMVKILKEVILKYHLITKIMSAEYHLSEKPVIKH